MSTPRTLLAKLWDAHEVLRREDGASLLWVDRHLVHEGSHHAFAKLAERGLPVAEPELTLAVADHYAPTRSPRADGAPASMIDRLAANAGAAGVRFLGLGDPRGGSSTSWGPSSA